MDITVLVKQVPNTAEIRIDPVKNTLIRDGVPSIINPDDKAGLEEALKLKDQFGATITVVSMGPPQAQLALREALAMGADRAILVSDRKFGGADTLATSTTLVAALKQLKSDLIIAGRQAIDGDTAQVGPQVAEMLDIPQVSYVQKLHYDGKQTLQIQRLVEDGYYELEVDFPCLITVLAEANKPRYMHIHNLVDVFSREIEIWDFERIKPDVNQIGLTGSPTKVKKSYTKGVKQSGKIVEAANAEEAAEAIVTKLQELFMI
ncbi:electron transfer flavoprotein subunit beta/FixA family protein [Entomospira nematocerorum]|uniref:Electron transfer flavoprotein subunit beta/FixA family protein n=1 Tax=Entomospira nematocerorum TaxID=2719987 RepID=A0A968KSE3_9SPIO|nr:electron transfer flavoprotein subunit beta/FixA family protein [Entomospira nematocera]NIZ46455.1 electron transfer flavoprotein subunit beta/FixA family protein [Entomospira nematocera]WDI33743.1 electron transfer flavoprotein subunit beta/FixA family protein [Entomospira nematocera]